MRPRPVSPARSGPWSIRRTAIAATAIAAAAVLTASAAVASTTTTVTSLQNYAYTEGAARAEIAGNYGAPVGFGRTALELDTIGDLTQYNNQALLQLWYDGSAPALPADLWLDDLSELSVWVYRDGASTTTATPLFELNLDAGGGASHVALKLRPADNPFLHIPANTWTKLDLLRSDAQWWVAPGTPGGQLMYPGQGTTAPLAEIITKAATTFSTRARVSRVFVVQGDGTVADRYTGAQFTALDGLRFTTHDHDVTFDFESGVTTKDDCKNDGWTLAGPNGPWKNQGECIASFISAH